MKKGALKVTLVALAILIGLGVLMYFTLELKEVPETQYARTWLPLRIVLYATVIGFWNPLSRFLVNFSYLSAKETDLDYQVRSELIEALRKSRLKVSVFFIVIDIALFQQFGLIYGR